MIKISVGSSDGTSVGSLVVTSVWISQVMSFWVHGRTGIRIDVGISVTTSDEKSVRISVKTSVSPNEKNNCLFQTDKRNI